MKTFPFVLINKQNMQSLNHFATYDEVEDFIWKLAGGFILLVDETYILYIKKLKYDQIDLKYRLNNELGKNL